MTHQRFAAAGLAGAVAAALLAAAPAFAQDGPSPERRFRAMDGDRDGRLSRDEFRGPPPAFDRIDRDRDGAITLDEFAAFQRRRAGRREEARPERPAPAEPQAALAVVDTHTHLQPARRREGGGFDPAANAALAAMDRLGVRVSIIMSPPLPAGRAGEYDEAALLSIARRFPGRFAVMAGGASLNPMIDGAPRTGVVDAALSQRFARTAEDLLRQGAAGFGEMTALHFSFYDRHPFEERAPDHPLFLLLADIAARHGVPIDLHMEAVVQPFAVPDWIRRRSASNPDTVAANIEAFERLLAHNRGARIVWAHVGMDTTNQRSPELMRRLFRRHPNLHASIKIAPLPGGVHWVYREGAGLNPAWRAVLLEFPDRFLIGSDEFHQGGAGGRRERPQRAGEALALLKHLPERAARRIASENAERLYRLAARR